ncbi:MAG TPA: ATP-binding protein [Verrucomicrobiae bacterium]|nr:ATP-binding protein [Verrucomicrobiae bacterium]
MSRELERRLLILAPVGKDGALLEGLLTRQGVASHVCASIEEAAFEVGRGAAVLMVAEEALAEPDPLAIALARQEPWSDLPLLVLTGTGASSSTAESAVATLGNVTLLERPIRIAALSSAVRTALRARERQYLLRAHLEERNRLDRRKDEFLATLAHELRNPLAPIRTSLDLLRLTGPEGLGPQVLETMERQVSHMQRLIDDLMDVSRVTRGTIQLRREPVDLSAVVTSAVEISRPQIQEAGHVLSVQLPDRPATVEGDPVRLAQVFSNLLNNAAKYTEAGGKIGLRASVNGGWAEVSVTDTGIGIAGDAIPHLFDMFYQAASGRRVHSGLGVGLTLVRKIVDMHGGDISVRSPGPGRGSEFVVLLPLSTRAVAPAPAPAADAVLPGAPRVLVVDDNRDAALMLAQLLRLLGAEVRVAHDGHEALHVFDEFRPAALFLDLGMPGMDGYEVAGHVRARDAGTLLVALTGWGQERDRQRTTAAGFSHHLVKPADAQQLRAVLAALSGNLPAADARPAQAAAGGQ